MTKQISAGILGFTYSRVPDYTIPRTTIFREKHIEIMDEDKNGVDHNLEFDASQVEILDFIRAYKIGREKGIEATREKISVVIEKISDDLQVEIEDMFDGSRIAREREWEEKRNKWKLELQGMLSEQGEIIDPAAYRQRIQWLCELLGALRG